MLGTLCFSFSGVLQLLLMRPMFVAVFKNVIDVLDGWRSTPFFFPFCAAARSCVGFFFFILGSCLSFHLGSVLLFSVCNYERGWLSLEPMLLLVCGWVALI